MNLGFMAMTPKVNNIQGSILLCRDRRNCEQVKSTLVVFCCIKGHVHREFVRHEQSVNLTLYCNVLSSDGSVIHELVQLNESFN